MEKNMNWHYYNHAIIPNIAPHETPDLTEICSGNVWKHKGALLARWTSNWDLATETNWWYVIKDTPFDISSLKAKRRYEINKGNKNFEVHQLINPSEYAKDLCEVQIEAFSVYPKKYRPTVNEDAFIKSVETWSKDDCFVYGAFSREDNRLCGYAYLTENKSVLNFNVLKTRPDSEKYAVNAAIVYKILQDFNDKLENGYYICDGSRSILHETAFQDYLEKYFDFRKAYCELHIEYNPKYKKIILFLYKFRAILLKLDSIGLVHKINGIFKMQEIIERQNKEK